MRASENIGLWHLDRRGDGLFWDGCDLTELARCYGTPLYVVNSSLLKRSHDTMHAAFRAAGLEVRVFFSYKTNPVPGVLKCLERLGCGAEVISEFELWLAGRIGVGGERLVVNGSLKSPELLRSAVLDNAALINVESLDQLRTLGKVASDLGRPARVGLRINPCLQKSPIDFTLFSGTRAGHAGFRRGENEWKEALQILRVHPLLTLRGLHFHIGSGIRKPRHYVAATKAALRMWTDLIKAGMDPVVLDMGGGFCSPTVKELNLLEAIRLFGWNRPPAMPRADESLLDNTARACSRVLQEYASEHEIQVPLVYVEPGRALVASSQMLLLRVSMLKQGAGRISMAMCDAGAMSLSPLLLSETHRILPVNRCDGAVGRYNIVGNLPAPLDLVALRQLLPSLKPGDILAVMDVGAYFTPLGNNFGGPRPPIVLIEEGNARPIRRRETFEDMLLRDM